MLTLYILYDNFKMLSCGLVYGNHIVSIVDGELSEGRTNLLYVA